MKQLCKSCSKGAFFQVLKRFFPIFVWLPNYKIANLRYDIIAGWTVGLTLVPQCIAYVSMMNLRPEVGLYSAFAGQFIYFLMGTSKDASIGPVAIVSMITGQISAAVNPLYEQGDATCVTLLALFGGIALFLVGILNFGFIVNLFSIPVVSGFTTAAGITIAASQLADLVIGICVIAFLLFAQFLPRVVREIGKRWKKRRNRHLLLNEDDFGDEKANKMPRIFEIFLEILSFVCACKNIIVFAVTLGIAYSLSPGSGITLLGYIKPGMPPLSVPRFEIVQGETSYTSTNSSKNVSSQILISSNVTISPPKVILKDVETTLHDLIVGFIVVPVMMIMEMFAILKALGRKNGYRVDARQELMAVGLANVVTSFLGGVPVTVSVTRCALNDQCHVRSQLASVISACVVIASLTAATPAFYYIPKATLAAIIIVAALNLVDFEIIPDVWRHCRSDAILLVFTILICVFFEMSYGVIICLTLNALILLRAVVHTQLHITRKHPTSPFSFGDSEHPNSVTIVQLSHGMKYPSADKFLDKVAALLEKESHLIIDCTFVQSVDYTGVQAFRSLLLSAVQKGLHVVFANLNNEVHREFEKLGLDHFHHVSSVEAAIGEYNKAVVISEMEAVSDAAAISPANLVPGNSPATSTTDLLAVAEHHPIAGDLVSAAKQLHDEHLRKQLLHELRVQPHFYGDVPLVAGGNLDFTSGSSSEEWQVADDDNEAGDESEQQISAADQHASGEGTMTPRQRNVQFMNTVLLHQVSRNCCLRHASSSQRLAFVDKLTSQLENRQAGTADAAIAALNDAPALQFIDIASPERLSPVFNRLSRLNSDHQ